MANIKLEAKNRAEFGKNRVNKLRNGGLIPAAIFEKGTETLPITISSRDFEIVYREAGGTSIVDVNVEGKAHPTIIKEIDRHPFKNQILHVNFQGVNMNEAIKVEVPIEFVGRDSIKAQPSVFNALINELHIECLPGDLPDTIEIPVEGMQIDDVIYVKDLEIAKNKKITILVDQDEPVCSLAPQQEVAEEESTETAAGDVPVVGEENKEEE